MRPASPPSDPSGLEHLQGSLVVQAASPDILSLQGDLLERHLATLLPGDIPVPQTLSPSAWSYRGIPDRPDWHGALAGLPLDVAWVPAGRNWADVRLLAMDMDSTLITIECIDELADFAGVKPRVAAITEAAMRGELEFQEALRRRVDCLAGLSVSVLQQVYESRLRLSPGAEELLRIAQASGIHTLLVSGGFTYFTGRLQHQLGLSETLANELDLAEGRLTGKIRGSIVDGAAKAARVASVMHSMGLQASQVVVVGDGANDVPMMRHAGVSVAFRAKPVVRAQATHALQHAGLDGIRHLFH